jgi:phage-related minor tail protein
VDAGRSAFGQMFVDGKFNIDNLASYALRTLGEQLFERLGFGRTFAQLGDLVFDGIESVVGGVAGDGRAAEPAPSAERDILRRMEAAAAEEIAQSVAETAASANETAATLATTNSLIALQAAAELAGESLLSIGAGGGDGGLGGLVGDLFGGSGGFLNDQGGTEVLGSLGFAKGAAFNAAGTVDRFARGAAFTNQVITKPTLFKFARGTKLGEMGEAGAEGIFPLGRTRSGELGVKMAGPAAAPVVQLNVEVVNTAPNARVRTEQRQDGGLRVLVEQIEGELGSRIDNGGGLLRNITQRTGVNGSAGLVL